MFPASALPSMTDKRAEMELLEFGRVGFTQLLQIVMQRAWLADPAPTGTERALGGILVPLEDLDHIVDCDFRGIPGKSVSPTGAPRPEDEAGL